MSALLNLYFSQPAFDQDLFVDVAAIILASMTLLQVRGCQTLSLCPSDVSFGIGNYFRYVVPPPKELEDPCSYYVPAVRYIACSPRYYNSELGDWFRLLKELYARSKHAPSVPMLEVSESSPTSRPTLSLKPYNGVSLWSTPMYYT